MANIFLNEEVMTFNEWLLSQGPKSTSVIKYENALKGRISSWGKDAGIISESLLSIANNQELHDAIRKIEKLKVFQEADHDGNNMYSSALKWLSRYAREHSNIVDEIRSVQSQDIISTEKEQLVQARVGQGRFRSDLIKLWGQCSLSGYKDVSFLVASHIKPWISSDNAERLDPYNGLLLLPNLDKAFDRGLITFKSNGQIMISKQLLNPSEIGIQKQMKINLLEGNQQYMEFHRNEVFKK